MADKRIKYTDEMIGANHPMKADTLNALKLVEHDSSGFHRSISFPSFFVHLNGTVSLYTTANEQKKVPFGVSTAGIEWDDASGFDSSGYYTIPKTGKWFLSVNLYSCNLATADVAYYGYFNLGTTFQNAIGDFEGSYNTSTQARSMSGQIVYPLSAGNKIAIGVYAGSQFSISGSSLNTWFCGAFLGE